jgi:predicted urease superfamily metal-dependent hydrolase
MFLKKLAVLFQAPGDARFIQIVRGHFHFDAVAGGEANPAFAHFAADGGEDHVFVVEFDAEHGSRQYGVDAPFYFNVFFSH